MENVALTVVFDPESMKVKEVRGREQAVAQVLKRAGRTDYHLRDFLGDDELTDGVRQPWFGVPRIAVAKGTASRDATVSDWFFHDSFLGSFEGVREFSYEGFEDGKDRMRVAPKLTYRPRLAADPQSSYKVQKGTHLESKHSASHGSIVFDRAKGRTVEAVFQTTMEGVVVWEDRGVQRKDNWIFTQKLRFTTSDEMPESPK